jgi:intein/homing endonuclease
LSDKENRYRQTKRIYRTESKRKKENERRMRKYVREKEEREADICKRKQESYDLKPCTRPTQAAVPQRQLKGDCDQKQSEEEMERKERKRREEKE